jgi:hypothetical protein
MAQFATYRAEIQTINLGNQIGAKFRFGAGGLYHGGSRSYRRQLLPGAGLITAAATEAHQSLQAVSIEHSSRAEHPNYIRKGHLSEARER